MVKNKWNSSEIQIRGDIIKIINPKKIKMIDVEIKETCCNSDGKPLFATDEINLTAIYHEDVISSFEVRRILNDAKYDRISNPNMTDDPRIMVVPTSIAHNLSNIFKTEDLHGIWSVLESSEHNSNHISDFDPMKTFESEQKAIQYQMENRDDRVRKYIRITHDLPGGDNNE